MQFKPLKDDKKVSWTQHVARKMMYYGISEALVRRVIRRPGRIEKGVAENTIAVMQPTGYARAKEVWVMYQILNQKSKKIRVISAWRYPGRSPVRGPLPIPDDILAELGSPSRL